jgi:hypothetical protein
MKGDAHMLRTLDMPAQMADNLLELLSICPHGSLP